MKTAERNSAAINRFVQAFTPVAGFPANAVAVREMLAATISLYIHSGCKNKKVLSSHLMLDWRIKKSNA